MVETKIGSLFLFQSVGFIFQALRKNGSWAELKSSIATLMAKNAVPSFILDSGATSLLPKCRSLPFLLPQESLLFLVKHNLATHQFNSLDEAMAFAKELGEFVSIQFDGKEVVGVFGATGVADGKCPDGMDYSWKKRRK